MSFTEIIINWFYQNQRNLPWRASNHPYFIWLSEIILQQTRMEQGVPYYLRFIEKFPDIQTLAEAPLEDVLKQWQGLGYYSRARNLHTAAHQIIHQFNGKFPCLYEDILTLKGVGEYTAAAIASIAFNLPHPVLDGNVYRVLSRFYGIVEPINTTAGKKIFLEKSMLLISHSLPSAYNQGVMEFGALVCTPQAPHCDICPLMKDCFAFQQQKTKELPVKLSKNKIRSRYLHYLVLEFNEGCYLYQRKQKDVFQELFEFPLVELEKQFDWQDLINNSKFKEILQETSFTVHHQTIQKKHILSHQHLFPSFTVIHLQKPINTSAYFWLPLKKLNEYPVHKIIERFILNNYQ